MGADEATASEQLGGILSISPSSSDIFVHPVIIKESIFTPWGFDFDLPSHGEAHIDCGSWRTNACLNVSEHHGVLLDGTNIEGLPYVRRYQKYCFRPECPICFMAWCKREAKRIEHRFLNTGWIGKVIHVVVAPSDAVIMKAKSFDALKKEAYRLAKLAGLKGACCIPHGYSRVCSSCGSHIKFGYKTCLFCGSSCIKWRFNPHFHMLGFGWIENTAKIYKKHDWVIKNLRIRKSVFHTALYQLSHAGIRKNHHCVTWFGSLSYNKIKVPAMPVKKHNCPACGCAPQRVIYTGNKKLPEVTGDFWFGSPEDFIVISDNGLHIVPDSDVFRGSLKDLKRWEKG